MKEARLLALLLAMALGSLLFGTVLANISIDCKQICQQAEDMHGEDDEAECDVTCRAQQGESLQKLSLTTRISVEDRLILRSNRGLCHRGCGNWSESTVTSCQETCADEASETRLFCAMGCVYAAQSYIQQVRAIIATPKAPHPVGGGVRGQAVSLWWTGEELLPEMKYLVQYRSAVPDPGEWLYYRPNETLTETTVEVKDLTPYTRYQFRVAWLVLPMHAPVMSSPSTWISTLAAGPPSSPPENVKAIPLDWSRAEVTWDPPTFPGGDVISYTLYLKDGLGGHQARMDISVAKDRRYIFTGLTANTTYALNVSATNHQGEGPSQQVHVTTYPSSSAVEDGSEYLLLSSGPSILRLGLDIMDPPKYIYNISSTANITGLAIHQHVGIVFFGDTQGYLRMLRLSSGQNRTLLTPSNLHGSPLSLSIDWLFGRLYFVVRLKSPGSQLWQVWRCDLDKRSAATKLVVSELHYEPKQLQADPFNGYLWWISEDLDGGLYRLDLGLDHEGETHLPRQVLKSPDLGGLTLDPPNFRVLVANRKNNTMLAVTLDGTSTTDLRANTQQAYFAQLQSVAHLNNRFFWTDGSEVFTEELNDGTFYHTSYGFDAGGSLGSLLAVHKSTQPIPVPLNPSQRVQAIFTRTSAVISWDPPVPPALIGVGAWQRWSYEVHLEDGVRVIYKDNITQSRYQALNLRPNTYYSIKVRAYSPGGYGPWSEPFHGRTLATGEKTPQLVWATLGGVMVSDVVGNNATKLLSQETIKTQLKNGQIVDLTFFRSSLVMAVSNQSIHVLDMKTLDLEELSGTHGAMSVAVDWFTARVFWANPYKQMIGWSHLEDGSHGLLGPVTSAGEVRVDSTRGAIYWTTTQALYRASLSGKNLQTIHQEGLFSGKQVYGLTLDVQNSFVWWIVRDASGCQLFRATASGDEVITSPGSPLQHDVKPGPLVYLSDRLLWLGDEGNVIFSDTNLNNSASLSPAPFNITRFVVVHSSLQPFPDNIENPYVIPRAVNISSVRTNGVWDNFTIDWSATEPTDFGDIVYDVVVDDGKKKYSYQTNTTSIPFEASLQPHSPLRVSLRGYTNWGIGGRVVANVRSPQSFPEEPTQLRTFVDLTEGDKVEVILRWSPPNRTNGIIVKYEVIFCVSGVELECENVSVNGSVLQYSVLSPGIDHTYRFKVRSFTAIGGGPYSEETVVSTSVHRPMPRLLIAQASKHFLGTYDADANDVTILYDDTAGEAKVSALLKNGTAVWMDGDSDIHVTSLKSNLTQRLQRLQGSGVDLGVDWLSESVLWAETDSADSRKINLRSYDLNFHELRDLRNLHFDRTLIKTTVEPLSGLVYLMAEGKRSVQLTVASLRYNDVYEFFTQRKRSTSCSSCRGILGLTGGIALDYLPLSSPSSSSSFPVSSSLSASLFSSPSPSPSSAPHPPATFTPSSPSSSESQPGHQVYLATSNKRSSMDLGQPGVISASHPVYRTDARACDCQLVFDPAKYGLGACRELGIDSTHLFCYSPDTATLAWLPKDGLPEGTGRKHLRIQRNIDLASFVALDAASQPLPDPGCLVVPRYDAIPDVVGSHATAIAFKIHPPKPDLSVCQSYMSPPVQYTVYYGPLYHDQGLSCSDNIKDCKSLTTTKDVVTVENLTPYTHYVFRVAAETVYNRRLGVMVPLGPETKVKTKAKAPDSVRKITALPLSPEEILVEFESHTQGLMYQIHFMTEGSIPGSMRANTKDQKVIKKTITKLRPATKYMVWVRLFSEDQQLHSDSPRVTVWTQPQLPPLILTNATANSLLISWTAPQDGSVVRHSIQSISDGQPWNKTAKESSTKAGQEYLRNFSNLQPASRYLFRLQVVYQQSFHKYTWPREPLFNYSTLGDVPSAPSNIVAQQGGGGRGWKVQWQGADPHGTPIVAYTLQAAPYNEDMPRENLTFITVYNGSNNYWPLMDLEASDSYLFRVRALNAIGYGPWSELDVIHLIPTMLPQSPDLTTILASTIPTSIIFFGALLAALFYVMRCTERRRCKVKAALSDAHRSREVELATLRELPRNNNFVTETNVLYNLQTFPGDDLDLPRVSRHCITPTKFLGRGAFGEVFEGTARGLPGMPDVTKVAIKTLRKGATENEKAEFLKEAQLMSHFQHDHILRLLAVCTDHDPFFLILELMEGGDLLSYLRSNRDVSECGLTLSDLVAMCVDVAKGCVYLEEMHFVHRDLAARNCLVASRDSTERVVKIGDFGLARDIYKNDYYRKEGEGLLPVRWMSPESLVDGVFTSQSDVWAFGVLLWEILTLGQQPYPARTNLEVLQYVRSGGRLHRPPNCPEELHKLMVRCWSYSPDSRPTFRECLVVLEGLQQTISALPALAVHNVHYVSSLGFYGLDNLAYDQDRDENYNTNSGGSMASREDSGTGGGWCRGTREGLDPEECDSFSGASTLPLTTPLRRTHQYLQLLNESNSDSPSPSPLTPRAQTLPVGTRPPTQNSMSLGLWSLASSPTLPSSPGTCTYPSAATSPVPDSPTSVTFTFPLPPMPPVKGAAGVAAGPGSGGPSSPLPPQHYLKPSSNRLYQAPNSSASNPSSSSSSASSSTASTPATHTASDSVSSSSPPVSPIPMQQHQQPLQHPPYSQSSLQSCLPASPSQTSENPQQPLSPGDAHSASVFDTSCDSLGVSDIMQDLRDDLDRLEEEDPEVSQVLLRHKGARGKSQLESLLELENNRLSGVSALSALSGLTTSTVDLDSVPGQSWC